MATTYVGQRKRASVTLTLDNQKTNGTVTWSVLSPDGHAVAVSSANPHTGEYYADFTCDEPGPWTIRFVSTGAVVAATETTIDVVASPFYPSN